ncbi:hypothetical protein SAMN05421837_10316 [Amycolatopsis pretoriensis]|uniref:NB-ARC domain-containing protein n=1 Tax=Amycolatopsis pretoriensis TaxID=218821 RepID=A0A1H5QKR9_9PSEU|nr:ATP-binding protein [Amycolatopsis pretoriensis]SEF25951.1 hypothetical protein SAMN05421837_10316 [Amycolatopsis pretoriensis]
MTADRYDVFLCPTVPGRVAEALRAGGLRVFRGSSFDDLAPELAASRVVLAGHSTVPGESLADLVRRVREKAAAGPGCSLLWAVHSELVARRAVLVRGLPGIGKTALAEQYACLAGGFGGRVLRTGPFGHLDPDEFLPEFHLALAAATGTSGGGFDRLRKRLAARIDSAGSRVLVLVDDVPAGLPPGELARVLLPASRVRTLVTSRAARWPGATVEVPGLTVAEGRRLLRSGTAPDLMGAEDRGPLPTAVGPDLTAAEGCRSLPAAVGPELTATEGRPSLPTGTAPDLTATEERQPLPAAAGPDLTGTEDRRSLPAGTAEVPSSTVTEDRRRALPSTTPDLTVIEDRRSLPAGTAEFIARCDGHPMTLRAAAFLLARGEALDGLPDTAPHAIREVLLRLGRPVCEVLRLGSVLAPSPIPVEVVAGAVSGGEAAVEELVARGFAVWAEGGLRLQALAVEVARAEFGEPPTDGVAEVVSRALAGASSGGSAGIPAGGMTGGATGGSAGTSNGGQAGGMTGGSAGGSVSNPTDGSPTASPPGHLTTITHTYLIQHARVLANHSPAHRAALLRPVATAYETLGDPATAGEIHAAILGTAEATSADLTSAARVELSCGFVAEALAHTRQAAAGTDRPAP